MKFGHVTRMVTNDTMHKDFLFPESERPLGRSGENLKIIIIDVVFRAFTAFLVQVILLRVSVSCSNYMLGRLGGTSCVHLHGD